MPTSFEGLKIMLLLVPGFLTMLIHESLAEKKARSPLDKVFTILLYDIFIFGIYLAYFRIFPSQKLIFLNIKSGDADLIKLSFQNVVIISIISMLLGIFFAVCNIYGWPYKLLRKLKITYRTGRSSVWNDVFYENQGNYLIVHLDDGVRIFGWASDFSADPDPKYLFIKEAKYLGSRRKADVEVKGPGLLITNESKIKYIEFLSPVKEEAK